MNIAMRREQFALRCDSELAQLAALRAGFGIGACQLGIARRDPELQRVLPEQLSFTLEMWLAVHRDLRSSRRIALLFEFLTDALGRYVSNQS